MIIELVCENCGNILPRTVFTMRKKKYWVCGTCGHLHRYIAQNGDAQKEGEGRE